MTNEKENATYVIDASSEFVSKGTDMNGNTVYVVDTAGQAAADAAAAEEARRQRIRDNGSGVGFIAWGKNLLEQYVTEPDYVDYMYKISHQKVCRINNLPETTDWPAPRKPTYPIWSRIIMGLINLPIWRLGFAVLVFWFASREIQVPMDRLFSAFDLIINWFPVIVFVALHSVFGFVTTPIRIVLSYIDDIALWTYYEHFEEKYFEIAKNNGIISTAEPSTEIASTK